jgi:hypothetical protein
VNGIKEGKFFAMARLSMASSEGSRTFVLSAGSPRNALQLLRFSSMMNSTAKLILILPVARLVVHPV